MKEGLDEDQGKTEYEERKQDNERKVREKKKTRKRNREKQKSIVNNMSNNDQHILVSIFHLSEHNRDSCFVYISTDCYRCSYNHHYACSLRPTDCSHKILKKRERERESEKKRKNTADELTIPMLYNIIQYFCYYAVE